MNPKNTAIMTEGPIAFTHDDSNLRSTDNTVALINISFRVFPLSRNPVPIIVRNGGLVGVPRLNCWVRPGEGFWISSIVSSPARTALRPVYYWRSQRE